MDILQSALLDYYSETNPLTSSFQRTAYSLKAAIANGFLKPGDFVPSTKILADLFQINPMTISRALQDLNILGLIYGERGKKYVVTDKAETLVRLEIERDLKNHTLGYLLNTMKHFGITKATINQWLKEINVKE